MWVLVGKLHGTKRRLQYICHHFHVFNNTWYWFKSYGANILNNAYYMYICTYDLRCEWRSCQGKSTGKAWEMIQCSCFTFSENTRIWRRNYHYLTMRTLEWNMQFFYCIMMFSAIRVHVLLTSIILHIPFVTRWPGSKNDPATRFGIWPGIPVNRSSKWI